MDISEFARWTLPIAAWSLALVLFGTIAWLVTRLILYPQNAALALVSSVQKAIVDIAPLIETADQNTDKLLALAKKLKEEPETTKEEPALETKSSVKHVAAQLRLVKRTYRWALTRLRLARLFAAGPLKEEIQQGITMANNTTETLTRILIKLGNVERSID